LEGVLPVAADWTASPALRGPFPRALVDAPCSGTGTFRRRPEIRWRLREADLAPLAARQSAILKRVAGVVPPGGALVYSVCSVEPEEGEAIIVSFLDRHRDFALDDPAPWLPEPARELVGPDRIVRTVSEPLWLDGFQAARLVRR
jgi:16S rRNA (cytosine967-C5)-methyltransferase